MLTLEIDNALLRPRAFDRGYTKSRLEIRAGLRPVGSDTWGMLRADVDFALKGEQWKPSLPYPVDWPGPLLRPILDWKIERSPESSTDPSGLDAESAATPAEERSDASEARS